MYESELNSSSELLSTLPESVRSKLHEGRDSIESRTLLPWGEHCTECNWPTCYSSCELYTSRADGACRLFIEGVVRIDHPGGLSPYVQKIRFKRWAKLWTVGTLRLFPLTEAEKAERKNQSRGTFVRRWPLPRALKKRALVKFGYLRRKRAEQDPRDPAGPDAFIIECFNPNDREITLSLMIRPRELNPLQLFQKMLRIPPGFVRDRTPMADVRRHIDLTHPFEVEIVPNDSDDTVLYFGLMDFVKEKPKPVSQPAAKGAAAKTWKCIVWDLDNTLWDGILIEDGPGKLRMRPEAVQVILETDRRGILHSVASKNNPEDAINVLRDKGLIDYFLQPQIGWHPKSESVARIAKLLNIGIDTLAFVDDQEFEREEVKAALPQVTVIDAKNCAGIPDRPECQVPVTEESRQRRSMYRQQEQRDATFENFKGDYAAFLRDCHISLQIGPLNGDNIERVYELAQRTNQMNFSGNRYPQDKLREIMRSGGYETHVMRCSDRFGSYGIVGFAVVDTREPRLLDLMFSCRIQSKRVEHAFFTFLLDRHRRFHPRDFFSNYKKTQKNAPAGKVFEEIGFEFVGEEAGITSLVFKASRAIPDDKIIEVQLETDSKHAV